MVWHIKVTNIFIERVTSTAMLDRALFLCAMCHHFSRSLLSKAGVEKSVYVGRQIWIFDGTWHIEYR